MKQTIEQQQFSELMNQFSAPIEKWQNKKPAKRNAFMLFCDKEVGSYKIIPCGNDRAKYPLATCLEGLGQAMIDYPDLLGWVKANVRFAERELKRKYELLNTTKNGNSNS